MLSFVPALDRTELDVLLVGAHPDDIEIGCGGTLIQLAKERDLTCHWVVLTADEERAAEAAAAAHAFCADAVELDLRVQSFPDSYLPYAGRDVKAYLQSLATQIDPDIVFTHHVGDLHQDHRIVGELCWNAFRNQVVLEYEVPKYDGDLGRPNVFVEIDGAVKDRKLELLMSSFPSQAERDWFTAETFAAMLRIRGIEARASSGYAEAFYARKLRIASR